MTIRAETETDGRQPNRWRKVNAWLTGVDDALNYDPGSEIPATTKSFTMGKMIACLFLAVILQPGFVAAEAEIQPKILMYVTDGSRDLDLMLTDEVGVMRQMLEDAGYSVDIATSAGQEMVSETTTLTPTVSLSDVDIQEYAGVILPCMAPAPGTAPPPAAVGEILQQAIALGKPVAASRGSVVTLAKAGGIAGREYAFAGAVDTAKRPEFENGTYLGIGIVHDGNITTSGICPLSAKLLNEQDGTTELTRAFIMSLADSS